MLRLVLDLGCDSWSAESLGKSFGGALSDVASEFEFLIQGTISLDPTSNMLVCKGNVDLLVPIMKFDINGKIHVIEKLVFDFGCTFSFGRNHHGRLARLEIERQGILGKLAIRDLEHNSGFGNGGTVVLAHGGKKKIIGE